MQLNESTAYAVAPAEPADLEQVSGLVADATRGAFDHPDLTAEQRAENRKWAAVARQTCAAAMAHPDKAVFAARAGADLLGFALIDRTDAACPEIGWVMVAPQAHGRGVAQSLMAASLAWIGPGVPVKLTVIGYNARAIAFYGKYGFADAGPAPGDYAIPRRLLVRQAS